MLKYSTHILNLYSIISCTCEQYLNTRFYFFSIHKVIRYILLYISVCVHLSLYCHKFDDSPPWSTNRLWGILGVRVGWAILLTILAVTLSYPNGARWLDMAVYCSSKTAKYWNSYIVICVTDAKRSFLELHLYNAWGGIQLEITWV